MGKPSGQQKNGVFVLFLQCLWLEDQRIKVSYLVDWTGLTVLIFLASLVEYLCCWFFFVTQSYE